MKKRNLIVIIIALVLVVGILTTILILKGSIWQKEKITDELKQAQATFDIRLNSDSTEYYIYRLKPSANTDGATITIPDSVDGIPVTKLIDRDLGFSSYNNITKIIIGKNISYIGTNTTVISDDTKELGDDFFSLATSLITIEVSVENKNFSSNNGILYNKNQTILLRYPAGRTMSNNQSSHRFVIPNTVILIYKKAFSLNKTLEMVTFGENVEAVDDEAFSGCENLVSVNFDNSNIKSIGTKAFERCLNLSSVVLPIELERLGSSAFMGCSKLTYIYFSNSILEIGRNCFTGCSNLKSIYTNSEFVDRLKEIFAQNNEKFIDKIQQISSN
ncbi:MAG: leucine-rich repeat domain-containing protein [Staphylococcus sp.]|jgi:hypothetical protein|nr:leucine-rich repeat domain-containing protein [Staphylococcus sp.]